MTRLGVCIPIILAGLVSLAGCPSNEYDYETWTKQLEHQSEAEAAVTRLEQLGHPGAIPAIGKAWENHGRPVRYLQVIIALARPLTPKEAEEKHWTDFAKTGRKASWDAALPFLKKALVEVDTADTRSVDGASKAADALGESKTPGGLEALVDIANRKLEKKLLPAQVAAIRAIGKYDTEKAAAAAALQKIIDREPPAHPRTAKDKEARRAAEEEFGMFLASTGAAINALAELRAPTAAKTLALQMYRTPELFEQVRRALVASGPEAKAELQKILRDKHTEVNTLFAQKKLGKYCGDRGDAPPDQCQDVSMRDFYAAMVLGDFYDTATVDDLLLALERPALPAFYVDEQAGATNYAAIFEALKKIGAEKAAPKVRAMWAGAGAPAAAPKKGKKGAPEPAPAAGGADLPNKLLAIGAYPFLTRDGAGTEELGAIAGNNDADDLLRQEAATAYARLAKTKKATNVLTELANKYFEASAKKRAEAEGKPKAEKEAADKELEKFKKKSDEAKIALVKITKDKDATAEQIQAQTDKAKKAEDDYKAQKKKHKAAIAPYKALDRAAKDYKAYARMFQTHIARIEVAIRCGDKLQCYADTLKLTPDAAVGHLKDYIKDLKDWTKEEKQLLVEANVERAMLELGKRGSKAQEFTDVLLDHAKSDNRIIRQSILFALPKIAQLPCKNCETKLQAAIKAGEGKTTLGQLNFETTMLRNYFSWAGGNTPSGPAEAPPADDKSDSK